MNELHVRDDLQRELRIAKDARGRSAITGTKSARVWISLRLSDAEDAANHTKFLHLTVGTHQEFLHAIVIVPHGIKPEFR